MATDFNPQPEREPQPSDERHEKRDANVPWLFAIIGGLLLAVVGAQLVVRWTTDRWEKTPPPTDRLTGARRTQELVSAAGSFPRLQVSPPADLKAFRAREDVEMSTYGWINRTAGVVRIPVARAIDLLLQRGLPVRAGTNQSQLGPTPFELQQQRTNATAPETQFPR